MRRVRGGMRALLPFVACVCGCRAAPEPNHRPTPSAPLSSSSVPAVTSSSSQTTASAGSAPAPFVIAFVVDQFSAWIAEERLALLPSTGGFARLRKEGTWVKAMRLPYAVTDTAPGHASLHTGRVPAETGIWGNELPDRSTGGRISFLLDDGVEIVAPAPTPIKRKGSSAARLNVENVADRLRARNPDALIVSISVKDRGAIMSGGHKPSVALWFDTKLGSFVTSTAFASTFPAWASPIANAAAVAKARSLPWTLSDEAWIKENARGVKDDAPGEGDLDGFGTVFPHVAKTSAAFRASPASDRMILDLALASLNALYDRSRPTFLTLSMTAADVLGHVFGPDSWEAWDHLYKLDAALGAFFREIEKRVGGPGNFSVLLAADHGNSSMPETVRARRPLSCAEGKKPVDPYERPICNVTGTRIEPKELQRDLRAEVTKSMGGGGGGGTTGDDYIEGFADPYVFLSEKGRALDPPKRKQVDDAVRRVFARRKEQVEIVYDVRDLATKCPATLASAKQAPARALAGEDVLTLVCRSWSDKTGAGDFYVVPKVGSLFDNESVEAKGTSHGSPWLYDRTVPLLVRGPGTDAMTVITDPVDFTAYSRIAAAFLGLEPAQARDILASLRAK